MATVANIDWPTSSSLTEKEQKLEVISILDSCKALNLNAVFLQIRPCGDALYRSKTEPWSVYLTGKQGLALSNFYDPLEYWIEEAHARGIELHAWFNPFRLTMNEKTELSAQNIAVRHPEWVIKYGDKRYLDPGEPQVVDYFCSVVKEVVDNYNIDGVHLDDYFYPYPIAGESFNDDVSYAKYGFGFETRADWRRNNVDKLVERLSQTTHEGNKGVKFGISPFGIWRNGVVDSNGSDTEGGITNYDDLYADVLLWLKNGWLDYVAPQIYWDFNHPKASYTTLVKWWSDNSSNTPLFVGEGLYKVNSSDKHWKNNPEMAIHVSLSRDIEGVYGNLFFSYKHFNRDLQGLKQFLKESLYQYPSIPTYFSDDEVPNTTQIVIKRRGGHIRIKEMVEDANRGALKRYGVYRFNESDKGLIASSKKLLYISYSDKIALPPKKKGKKSKYAITYIAANGQESPLSNVITVKVR